MDPMPTVAAVWETVRVAMKIYDSYVRVMPEAQDIMYQLQSIDSVIEALNKAEYAPSKCMEAIQAKSKALLEYVEALKTSNDKARSLYGEVGHFMVRVASAQPTRDLMQATFKELKALLEELVVASENVRDGEKYIRVVKNIKNPDARLFWRQNIGIGSQDWLVKFMRFIGSYNTYCKQHGPHPRKGLTREDQKRLLYALCSSEEPMLLKEVDATVSVYRFNELVESYSFPFDLAMLPEPPNPQTISPLFSAGERLSISKQIMGLEFDFSKVEMEEGIRSTINFMRHHSIQYFFSPQFDEERSKRLIPGRHIHRPTDSDESEASTSSGWNAIREHVKTESDEEDAWKDIRKDMVLQTFLLGKAAEHWARLMKGTWRRDPSVGKNLSEYPSSADVVDPIVLNRQHRSWKFFFERYMALWRIGQLSQAMFEDIDFPGSGRILTFLAFVEPLNEANWRFVLGNHNSDWPEGRPKVFTFLREQLQWKDRWLNDGKSRASKAPPPIPGGGWETLAQVEEAVDAWRLSLIPKPAAPLKILPKTVADEEQVKEPRVVMKEDITGVGPEMADKMDPLGAVGFAENIISIFKSLPCAFICRGGVDKGGGGGGDAD